MLGRPLGVAQQCQQQATGLQLCRRSARRRLVDVRAAAFGSFWPRLLSMQQASSPAEQPLGGGDKLARNEVALQTGPPGRLQHPFRVCTFNVLADGLAQSGDFVKVPISCLQWEHRLPLILQEIRAADADIICLQELNHFDVLAAALVPEGYSCFFRAKQPSPALKFGFPADGIALFYRHARFSCDPAPTGHCFESIDGQPAAQGFVTALLHDKLAQRHLLVAATHLKAKAGADNEQTRVHQADQLLLEVEHMQGRHMQLQQQQQVPSSRRPAVLLCGDFNTTPDSDTVQMLQRHQLGLGSIWDVLWAAGPSAPPHSNGSSSSSTAAAPPTNGKPSPSNGNGNSSSSQGGAPSQVQPPPLPPPPHVQEGSEFTTWKFRSSGVAKRTIDYILYSRSQLAPASRWCMLSEGEIGPAGLPNTRYPSDHMAVTCQFCWVEEGADA